MKELRYVKDLLFRYKYRYLAGILALIAVDSLQLVMPLVLGHVTDLLKSGLLNKENLIYYSIVLCGMTLGIGIFRFLWRYLVFGVSKVLEAALRARFYAHLQKLSPSYYNRHKTGDLMAHATNDINNVSAALGQGITMGFDSALIPLAAIIMMISTAGIKLTLASFLPLIALGVAMAVFVKLMGVRVQDMQEAFSLLTERARENFSGIRVVKAFVQENMEMKKFQKANAHNRLMNLRFVRLMSLMFPLVSTVSAFSFAIALWYGGIEVMNGNLTLGNFVAFNSFLGMLIWPIAALGWILSIFQRGLVSLKRINIIMDEQPEIADIPSPVKLDTISGNIGYHHLNFTYPGTDKPVLQDISISIPAGKTLAIVGPTGSGKTTLIHLLQRLYPIQAGTLTIDGRDIAELPLSLLRRNIGSVPQDTFLFSSTIKENIDFFQGHTDSAIENAARMAKVYDDILSFPNGFETVVGERGITLSGGQKQRIAIARAILSEPAILILDDCLSAVDTHTEEEILQRLREVMKNRTSIIVSHRISTIKDADEIIVLEDGRIAERGSHSVLLEKQGIYNRLYQKQLLSEKIEEEE